MYALQIIWIALFVLFLKHTYERLSQLYTVRWFRPLPCTIQKINRWNDIRKILEVDPLILDRSKNLIRLPERSTVVGDITLYILGVTVFVMVAYYWVLGNGNAPFLQVVADDNSKVLAVIGLVIGLYTAANELRAKVRSANRQKWIDEVRNNLAIVISGIPDLSDWKRDAHGKLLPNQKLYTSEANLAHLRLELLLNPSEEDHRTVSLLLRKGLGIGHISVDDEVIQKIASIKLDNGTVQLSLSNFDHRKGQGEHDQLISWIIRVSNAMLKREWERVKYGQ